MVWYRLFQSLMTLTVKNNDDLALVDENGLNILKL